MTQFHIKSLIAEILTIVLVTITFSLISDRLIAGRIAGSLFVLLGLYVCSKGFLAKEFRSTYSFKIGCLHLILAVIMIVTRIIYPIGSFANVNILGFIPGPIYHRLSTGIYMVLIFATALDIYKSKKILTKKL